MPTGVRGRFQPSRVRAPSVASGDGPRRRLCSAWRSSVFFTSRGERRFATSVACHRTGRRSLWARRSSRSWPRWRRDVARAMQPRRGAPERRRNLSRLWKTCGRPGTRSRFSWTRCTRLTARAAPITVRSGIVTRGPHHTGNAQTAAHHNGNHPHHRADVPTVSHRHQHHEQGAGHPETTRRPTSARGHQHDVHAGHDKHAGHSVEMFRQKFWGTLLLSVPTIVWAPMIQQWFGYAAPGGAARFTLDSRALRIARVRLRRVGVHPGRQRRDRRSPARHDDADCAGDHRGLRFQRWRSRSASRAWTSGGSSRRSSRSWSSATGSRCARSRRRRVR